MKESNRHKKAPISNETGAGIKSLAVTYSRTGKPRTTIGAKQFHFRVRYGIGWFPLAIAARQTVVNQEGSVSIDSTSLLIIQSQR